MINRSHNAMPAAASGERTALFEHAAGASRRNAVRDIDTTSQTRSVSQN
jgi:hypothetical protein